MNSVGIPSVVSFLCALELFGKCINTDRCALLLLTLKTNKKWLVKEIIDVHFHNHQADGLREVVSILVEEERQLTAGPSRRGTMQVADDPCP